MMCHKNSGWPCAHMIAVYGASNAQSLLESTIHNFWLLKDQVAVELDYNSADISERMAVESDSPVACQNK